MSDHDDTEPFDPLEDDQVFDDELPDELPRATPAGAAKDLDDEPDGIERNDDEDEDSEHPDGRPPRPHLDLSPDTEEDTTSGGAPEEP